MPLAYSTLIGCTLLLSTAKAMATSGPSCAVVGVGVLGTSLCRQILQTTTFADGSLAGFTKTTERHVKIRDQVCGTDNSVADRFSLYTTDSPTADLKFDNVIFCAPPSGFDDYAVSVQHAVDTLWNGPEHGIFLFTSSGAVYGPGQGSDNVVTERTPTANADSSPRVARLVQAEQAALQAGGTVLRLAGLYTLERGPHKYWFEHGEPIKGPPDGIVNALHYDDAATACLRVLQAGPTKCRGQTFLASDGHPLSRRDIVRVTADHPYYRDYDVPAFADDQHEPHGYDAGKGKVYDGSWTNDQLQWQPKYESFAKFMTERL